MPDYIDDYIASLSEPKQAPVQPSFSALPQEEKDNILKQLASSVGGGALRALNYVLDLPGRPIRTALAGENPLTVLGSIAAPSLAPSGEELAKKWGLLQGEGQKGTLEGRDLVGPAIEIATNPFTYINPLAPLVGGAKTAAGIAAGKVGNVINEVGDTTASLAAKAAATGKLAPTMASRLAAGQGALFEAGFPGFGKTQFGTGPTAQALAESIGGIQSAVGAAPGIRNLRALFQRPMEGQSSAFLQSILPAGAEKGAEYAGDLKGQFRTIIRGLDDLNPAELASYQADPTVGQFIKSPNDVLTAIGEGTLQPLPGALGTAGTQIRDLFQNLPAKQAAKGVRTVLDAANYEPSMLENYVPRSQNPIYMEQENSFRQPGSRPQLPLEGAQKARDIPDSFVRGRTLGLQDMSLNPDVGGAIRGGTQTPDQVQDTILTKYMGMGAGTRPEFDDLIALRNTQQLTPAQQARLDFLGPRIAQAQTLATKFGNLDPALVKQGVPFYNPDVLGQIESRLGDAGRTMGRAEQMLKGLQLNATTAGPGTVPLADIVEKNGFGSLAQAQIQPSAHIPASIADDVGRYLQSFSRPNEALSPFLKGYDAFLNLFKSSVSTIFPASRLRDLWQNGFMNVVRGNGDTRYGALDPRRWYQPAVDSYKTFIGGGVVADANTIQAVPAAIRAQGAEASTKWIADQAAARGLIVPGESQAALVKAGQLGRGRGETFVKAGETQPGILAALTEPGLTWNPLATRGMPNDWTSPIQGGLREETTNRLVTAGNRATSQIDDLSRGAALYGRLRQGYSFDAAADYATQTMYDYGNLSKFERNVMQRVIPFYSFMRQNIPAQLEEMIKNPGGGLANSVRISQSTRQKQGFVPESLGEGAALPIGINEETGRTRYLTHFGLPFEEALGPFDPSRPIQGTLQNVIGNLTPILRGPIEAAAGKSMMTGRPISDTDLLRGTIGAPFSRLADTAQKIAELPSRGIGATALELGSPFKIREANVEGARNAAAREGIQQMLEGNPNVRTGTYLSVPVAARQALSPRDQLLLQVYQSQLQRKPAPPRGSGY